ncbi:hypothetical protein Tco_0836562 [Tanacetum coccineum]
MNLDIRVNWDQQVDQSLLLEKTLLRVQDQDSATYGGASKVPMLQPCEYELWEDEDGNSTIEMIEYSYGSS